MRGRCAFGLRGCFVETDSTRVEEGTKRIAASLARAVERGKVKSQDAEDAIARIRGATDFSAFADADLTIEAAPEVMSLKVEILEALDGVLRRDAIIATNTSSLSVAQMGSHTRHPDRVVGLHFFNPAPVMKLVEVIDTLRTSEKTRSRAIEFVQALGKRPIVCRDRAGFIVNFLLGPYLNEAIHMYEQGFASIEEIDLAMKLGTGHPMGPFELLDTIGLDVTLAVQNSLYEEFKETRWAPAPLLKHMVAAGRLGKKTGQGFYDYGS